MSAADEASPKPFAADSPTERPHEATRVPGRNTRGADSLADGIRAEQNGDLARAVAFFETASRVEDPAVAAEALTRLADAQRSRNEWSEAQAAARRGQDVARRAGLETLVLHAMIAEANVLICRGQFADARAIFEQVLAASSDARMRGLALQNVGSILAQQGDLGAAERYFSESYGCFQHAGYRRGEATALINYGRVTLDRGDLALAEDLFRQAVETAREVEHAELTALATMNLAETLSRQGHARKAEDLASEALGVFRSSGIRWREVECLRLIGAINEQDGDCENAVACYERGLELARELGAEFEISSLSDCLARARRKKPG